LNGEAGQFNASGKFPNQGPGGSALRDGLVAFAPIVNGTIV
jgi:hypothetical protein